MRYSFLTAATAVAAVSATAVSAADIPAYCVGDASVAHNADKAVLARTMLDAGKVSRDLEDRVAASPNLPTGLTARQAITGFGSLLCASEANPTGIACKGDDAKQLDGALLSLNELFSDARFEPVGSKDPRRFFKEEANQLRCLPVPATTTPLVTADGAAGKKSKWYESFRVRGVSTDLIYSNTSDAYSDASKAKFAFGADGTKDKTTREFVLAIGYHVAFGPGVPSLVDARCIIEGFHVMIRRKAGADLDPWIARARASLVASFANGVAKDITAVRAAIVSQWSNGQTEGQITKLKLVKRQMYGRGKLDLLQARLIGAP